MPMCKILLRLLTFLFVLCSIASAQQAATTASDVVPHLVRFAGVLQDSGQPIITVKGVTFSLYANEQGGSPLWMEVQNVQPDSNGNYSVMLGQTKPDGLPSDVFISGEARWLGIQVEGQAEEPRVLLVAVPYALKAKDAETLGGQPASAYMLAPPAITNASGAATSGQVTTVQPTPSAGRTSPTPAKPPAGSTPVTTAGGTVGYLPLWDATSDIANSVLFQVTGKAGAMIGINTTTPVSTLDVKGDESVGGNLRLPATGIATSTTAFNSHPLTFTASVFNGGMAVPQHFRWQAEPTNFGVPSGSLNLLYASGSSAFSETGVNISAAGGFTAGSVFANSLEGASSAPSFAPVFGSNSDATTANYGVYGTTQSTLSGSAGVYGAGPPLSLNPGVYGTGDALGVLGIGTSTVTPAAGVEGSSAVDGVLGFSSSQLNPPNGIAGVVGIATSTSGFAPGVAGLTDSAQGTGVYGQADFISQTGSGLNSTGFGVWGDTGLTGGLGVLGTADDGAGGEFVNGGILGTTAPALVAFGNNASAVTTVFVASSSLGQSCGIDANGNLSCTGTKNAVVPIDGGTRYVAMSAVESPQNWFEDAGSAQLANGAAVVPLDPDFIQTVNTAKEYQVFLTPYGDCKGLYVTNRTAGSFEVHELGGGTASISFGYRIMALRKNYENVRFADRTQSFERIKQIGERLRTAEAAGSSHAPGSHMQPRPPMPMAHPPVVLPPVPPSSLRPVPQAGRLNR